MADQDGTLSVSELSNAISEALSDRFPHKVWVRGEITGYFHAKSGHSYFTLIEQGASASRNTDKISVTLFAQSFKQVAAELASANLSLQDGVEVRIAGQVGYYANRSQAQLLMSEIDPNFTLGKLVQDRAALEKKLQAEGLFDKNGALALTPVPLRVGLITSLQSAAHADFMHGIENSPYAFEVIECDARVQGTEAPESLLAAIMALEQYSAAETDTAAAETDTAAARLDVIAIVRGGGDRNDLLAFDTELVARAVANCALPVVVGIGHEIDESVVDKVAHTAYKTPTACADALVEMVEAFDDRLSSAARSLTQRSKETLASARRTLNEHSHSLNALCTKPLTQASRRLERAISQLQHSARSHCHADHDFLLVATQRLKRSALNQLATAQAELASYTALVGSHDPQRVLERGFSITRDAHGALVRKLPDVGSELITTVQAGTIHSTVKGDTTQTKGDTTQTRGANA